MRYFIARLVVNFIFRVLSRVKVYGAERIPDVPSFIAVSNHVGRLDAGLVYYLLDRHDIIMLVAEKYRNHAWSRALVWAVNGIYINRFNADLNALREVFRRLKQGGVMVVAPEGTRSKSGALQEGRDGASFIAARTGLTIMPGGLVGTQDTQVVSRLRKFKRLDIELRIGQPFTLPPLEGRNRAEQLKEYTDEIMCRIAILLPAEMRGTYADHPRTAELLAEQGEVTELQPIHFR
ncbi:MAG: 1-acyl-sn-glycerol-3-phosphate acyltransferase [Anaerolineales bacterium]|jgi:1-acyl-sn-glycerol-3-phosphate acyltransferase|nr:1-acyl-sn-glycerol-3-phosphate acyltransferase [Anaerolineales bacterium]